VITLIDSDWPAVEQAVLTDARGSTIRTKSICGR